MRFKLNLLVQNEDRVLPINYQYALSSWIYKTLNYGNPEFTNWLHINGYTRKNSSFKLFTFSRLFANNISVKGDRLIFKDNEVVLFLSFFPIETIESFIKGLFINQEFSVGDKHNTIIFRVNSIEKLKEPELMNNMDFSCLSPIHIRQKNPYDKQRPAQYLHPEHKSFEHVFFQNLLNKYEAYYNDTISETDNLRLEIKSEPSSALITLKTGTSAETKVKGYFFDFSLRAPVDLIKLGYYSGFGMQNSQGFGCCRVVEKHDN